MLVPAPTGAALASAKETPALRLLFPTLPLPIPALDAPTRAPWPVWSGSVANPVRFAALGKKAAVRLWHRARDFDRTRVRGRNVSISPTLRAGERLAGSGCCTPGSSTVRGALAIGTPACHSAPLDTNDLWGS